MSRNFISSLVQLSSEFDVDVTVYLALDQKNTRQAQKIATLKKYVNKHTSGWKKRLELAELLYATGQWSEAISEYRQVIEKQPRLIHPYIQLGKILQLMAHEDDAIALYEKAIQFVRYGATKYYLKGRIADCLKDRLGAIEAFQAATEVDPNNLTPWLALGKMQMAIEAPIDALASFDHILSIDPNDFMALIYSHDLLLQLGKLSDANSRLSRAAQIAPHDIQTLKRRLTHRYRKNLVSGVAGKKTKQLINALMTQADKLPEAHSLLARYYILRQETRKGRQIVQRFAEERAHNPQAWYYYSLCLQELGETELATDVLLRAYDLSGDRCDREIYRALCKMLPSVGKQKQLCTIIGEMLEKFPESWSLWSLAGRVMVEHFQEIDLGCRYAHQGTCLQPQLADAWFHYGRVLALADQHSSAIEALNKGWALQPSGIQSLNTVLAAIWIGESYQKLGENEEGQRWLQQAMKQAQVLSTPYPEKAKHWYKKAAAALEKSLSHDSIAVTPQKLPTSMTLQWAKKAGSRR